MNDGSTLLRTDNDGETSEKKKLPLATENHWFTAGRKGYALITDSEARYPLHLITLSEADTNRLRFLSTGSPVTFDGGITLAAIGLWLAQGAAQYVGGLAMAKILGHPTLSDIADMIRAAVNEIKNFVRAELQRQLTDAHFKEMQRDLEVARDCLRSYSRAQTSAEQQQLIHYLHNAVDRTRNVLHLAKIYDVIAIKVYQDAMSLETIALLALAKEHNVTSCYDDIRDRIPGGIRHVAAMKQKLQDGWADPARISPIHHEATLVELPGHAGEHPGRYKTVHTWSFVVDGVNRLFSDANTAQNARNAAWDAIRTDAIGRAAIAFKPIEEVGESWLTLLAALP